MIPDKTRASILLDVNKDEATLLIHLGKGGWEVVGNVHPTMRKQFIMDYLKSQNLLSSLGNFFI